METDKIKFKRTAIELGDSISVTIPKELVGWLGIKPKDKLLMIGEKRSHGNFIAFWKEGDAGDNE